MYVSRLSYNGKGFLVQLISDKIPETISCQNWVSRKILRVPQIFNAIVRKNLLQRKLIQQNVHFVDRNL